MRWIVFCLLLMVLASLPTFAPAAAQNVIPRFEAGDCRFDIPEGVQVECGDLVVLEDRAAPQGLTLRLHVAIFRSPNVNHAPDPVLFLDGGPGYSPLGVVPYAYWAVYAPFLLQRDLILIDQRGTGYSEPLMACTEIENVGAQSFAACHQRLMEQGLNLSMYNSRANAADIEDLRVALGIEQWNLYGVSYGTRVALTAMRDYPDGIRAAVLDSVYPPQVDLFSEFAANVDRAFDALFGACNRDVACSAAFPGLEIGFYERVAALTAAPAHVEFQHPGSVEPYRAEVDGYDLVQYVFQSLYSPLLLRDLPSVLDAANRGNYDRILGIQRGLGNPPNGEFSAGLYYTLQCYEEAAFSSAEAWATSADQFPALRDFASRNAVFGQPIYTICAAWGEDSPDPRDNEAVSSPIPTLILSGQFDPITPPHWATLAAQTLPNSTVYEFPALSHAVYPTHRCPQSITDSFLNDPGQRPFDSCLRSMPEVVFSE